MTPTEKKQALALALAQYLTALQQIETRCAAARRNVDCCQQPQNIVDEHLGHNIAGDVAALAAVVARYLTISAIPATKQEE